MGAGNRVDLQNRDATNRTRGRSLTRKCWKHRKKKNQDHVEHEDENGDGDGDAWVTRTNGKDDEAESDEDLKGEWEDESRWDKHEKLDMLFWVDVQDISENMKELSDRDGEQRGGERWEGERKEERMQGWAGQAAKPDETSKSKDLIRLECRCSSNNVTSPSPSPSPSAAAAGYLHCRLVWRETSRTEFYLISF